MVRCSFEKAQQWKLAEQMNEYMIIFLRDKSQRSIKVKKISEHRRFQENHWLNIGLTFPFECSKRTKQYDYTFYLEGFF